MLVLSHFESWTAHCVPLRPNLDYAFCSPPSELVVFFSSCARGKKTFPVIHQMIPSPFSPPQSASDRRRLSGRHVQAPEGMEFMTGRRLRPHISLACDSCTFPLCSRFLTTLVYREGHPCEFSHKAIPPHPFRKFLLLQPSFLEPPIYEVTIMSACFRVSCHCPGLMVGVPVVSLSQPSDASVHKKYQMESMGRTLFLRRLPWSPPLVGKCINNVNGDATLWRIFAFSCYLIGLHFTAFLWSSPELPPPDPPSKEFRYFPIHFGKFKSAERLPALPAPTR